MRKTIQKKHEKKHASVYKNALQLIVVGSVTGIFAGAVVTFFNILAARAEEIAYDGYEFLRNNPAFIPLLFVVLALGAFLLGVAVQVSSVARGCGIPQAEGGTRGAVRFRWLRDATTMFAACILSTFMGLSIGAEGPSVLIGACMGDGVASSTHRNEMIKRYQITGGACTGLAVASNAPLTGMIFAFEEAHKRFTPEVFVCAFSSVIFGVLTRSAIYNLLGMEMQSAFHSYVFNQLPVEYYVWVILAGILCGALGVLFHKLCFTMRALFKKIKTKDPKIRYGLRILIAVMLGGAFSLATTGALGGGHGLIEALGTYGGTKLSTVESILGELGVSVLWTLLFVLLLKALITTVNVGSGIPCGIFIPIIAIGACIGGVLSRSCVALGGMDGKYCDIMVMICMAAFFTTIVRAPLTAIIMICEFTGSFAPLLPAIIAVSIGYTIGEMSRTEGIYEELLEAYERENGIHENAVREVYILSVAHGALADRREVRDVLWPSGARVTEIRRGEEVILPDGDTVLHHGDTLTIVCKTDDPQKVKDELVHILE
ncbi:MAG: chloride channel protein [Clostridia bacterium]|nr:chloride channel protein [Clostridia bacterium]